MVWNIFYFSIYWNNHPNWLYDIFQRGRSTTNQLKSYDITYFSGDGLRLTSTNSIKFQAMVDVNRRFLGWGLSAYLGQWGCFSTRCESLALNVLGATNGWSLSSMSPQGIQQFSQNDPTLVQNDANNKSKTDPKWTFPQLDSISVNEFEPFLFSMSGPRQTPRGPTWANVAIHGQGDVKYSIILHRWIYIYK